MAIRKPQRTRKVDRMIRQGLLFAAIFSIRAYQALIRPLLAGSCKFCPSCSEYAIESLHRFGLLRGIALTARRLARCHPFSHGGIDPVPQDSAAKDQALHQAP
jgi:uncharacterized protein